MNLRAGSVRVLNAMLNPHTMLNTSNRITDDHIILMIRQNNREGWECMYEKYGSMMYSSILCLTDEKDLAEDILEECFFQLKKMKKIEESTKPLYLCLLHQTYITSSQVLKLKGLPVIESRFGNSLFPVLNMVIQNPVTMEEIIVFFATTKSKIKSTLLSDFKRIREIFLKEGDHTSADKY